VGDVIDAMLDLWNGGDLAAVEGVYTDPVRLGASSVPGTRSHVC
jgi:hypothetical protein